MAAAALSLTSWPFTGKAAGLAGPVGAEEPSEQRADHRTGDSSDHPHDENAEAESQVEKGKEADERTYRSSHHATGDRPGKSAPRLSGSHGRPGGGRRPAFGYFLAHGIVHLGGIRIASGCSSSHISFIPRIEVSLPFDEVTTLTAMSWEGPGFVDHHVHLLRVAAEDWSNYDLTDPASIAAFHRSVASKGSTPMDEHAPLGDRRDLPGMLERGLQKAAEVGLVQVTEAGMTDWRYLDALMDRREKGVLPIRVRILVASGVADPKRMSRTGDPWLEVIGVKLYSDGWLGPRTCALCSPYADEPDSDGVLFLDADELCRRIEPFAEAGWAVATHAIGDRAITAVLDAYEAVWGEDCALAAPRIEHAQVLSPTLMERIAHLGVVACIQPGFAVTDAAAARKALGAERAAHAYNWNALLDAGARVIAGSDYPIESLSPLEGLARMVSGAGADGRRVAEPVSLDRTLPLMTDSGAGTTVLSEDPAEVEPDRLRDLEVVAARPAGAAP